MYADKQAADRGVEGAGKLQRRMLEALKKGLSHSVHWKRSRGRDHVFVISSTRAMEQLYREVCADAYATPCGEAFGPCRLQPCMPLPVQRRPDRVFMPL